MRPPTIHIIVVTLALAMSSGCAVIRPGESARGFRPFSEGLDATQWNRGFTPWNTVVRYDTQLKTQNESVVVLTKDDLKIAVDASVILRPVPETVHLLEAEIGPDFYERVVQPKFRTSIRNVLATEQQQEQMVFRTEIAKRKAEITRINASAEAEAALIHADAKAKAQSVIDGALTPRYLQYKALESPNSKYFFMPTGKDGLPVMLPLP